MVCRMGLSSGGEHVAGEYPNVRAVIMMSMEGMRRSTSRRNADDGNEPDKDHIWAHPRARAGGGPDHRGCLVHGLR